MRYLRSYQYVFDNPQWLPNVLFGVLSHFIPVVGPIVWIGYEFEIIEAKHRRGDEADYPDFTFDRFGDYLMRGLWPFLIQLVLMLPFTLFFALLMVLGMSATMAMASEKAGWLIGVFVVVLVLSLGVGSFLMGLIVAPLYLRAGLSQDFASSFSLTFLRDFLGRTWQEMLVTHLFIMGSGTLAMLAGMAMLCLGFYPAAAVVGMAFHHLYYQIYELFLERGGIPFRLKKKPGERVGVSPPW